VTEIDLPPKARQMQENAQEAADFLKVLSNSTRMQVACRLVHGERSVRELEDSLRIRQPGLSQQLAALRAAGLIAARKQGRKVYYRLADDRVRVLIGTLYDMFCGR